jgi:lysophospholipase L1-like esterase
MDDRGILFFGDSFVNGAGDETGLGWPGRLVAAAWADGLPLTSYNLGVRGESTADVARRFRAEATPRVIPAADNRVVFAVGANDPTLDDAGRRRITEDESVRLMSRMLDECEELGATALVLSPGPSGIPEHDERSRALGDRFQEACAKRALAYIPVLDELLGSEAWTRTAQANDGLHPSAAGYAALADLLLHAGWLEWLRTGKLPS